MAQLAQQSSPQKAHWKDTAIAKSVGITDAWEVTKIYTGRLAEWILFACMIVNIIGILPGVHLSLIFTNVVMGVQVVTLDIAGFGLATMAQNARRHGAEKAANLGRNTAYTLIAIMMLTLILFTLGLMVPSFKPETDIAENVLILVRVGLIVFYGHVVHSLREIADDQPQPRQVNVLQEQIEAQRLEMQRIGEHYQKQLADLEQAHTQKLQTTVTEISQANEARTQTMIDALLAQVDIRHAERIEAMTQTITRVAIEEVKTTVQPLFTLPTTNTIVAGTTLQIAEQKGEDTRSRIRAIYLQDRTLSARAISQALGGTPSHPTVGRHLEVIKAELGESEQ